MAQSRSNCVERLRLQAQKRAARKAAPFAPLAALRRSQGAAATSIRGGATRCTRRSTGTGAVSACGGRNAANVISHKQVSLVCR